MLVIRDAQFAVLRRESIARFEDRIVQQLAERHPKQFALLGDSGAREFIRRAIAAGQAARIFTEGALATFIDLTIEFGEGFARAPDRAWARKILDHPKLPDHIRVDAIREKFSSRTDGRVLVPHGGGA